MNDKKPTTFSAVTRLELPQDGPTTVASGPLAQASDVLAAAAPDAQTTSGASSDASADPRARSAVAALHVGSDHDVDLGPDAVIKERFVLEAMLGQGGMGIVYRALDLRKQEAQDREPYVAIKILKHDFRQHPRALIALQRETRKAQSLAHPNIITVHDFDRDGSIVYMTMELLDGEPLDRVIAASNDGGLPLEKALPIMRDMAQALAYAHRKGIVHADFKPSNVFLTRTGEIKVLDFGIARAVRTELGSDTEHTVFDAAELGALTPSYASPDRLDGEAPLAADDVFALAVVGYELLTGRHPFGRVFADTARMRGLRTPIMPHLPRRQRKALARALALEREKRHADAGAFLQAFDGPSTLRRAAYVTALLVSASVAAYEAFELYNADALQPDVPWESLSDEERRLFAEQLEQGNEALRFAADGVGDYALNTAFDHFASAYEIHRNNPAAVGGLERVADGFLDLFSRAEPADARRIVRKLYCQEHLSTYGPVLAACSQALGPERCTPAALRCGNPEEDL